MGNPGIVPGKKAEKIRFQFRFQPWKDVLDWFAQQADLSLVMDTLPQGTFNYHDTREYTPTEAIDLLNSVLLTKGYTLVRRDRMLMLINIEDGVPANLVATVPVESLDGKGEFELVSVLFDLRKLRPEDVEPEVRKLLGPQGSVVAIAKSQQLFVTDTAGRLRAVRSVLKRMEGPEGALPPGLLTFDLKSTRPESVLPILRQLLEIPEEKPAAVDGSIRITVEAGTDRLIVSGRPDKVARAAEILKGLDVAAPGADSTARVGSPQLEIYPLGTCDASSAMAVLQTVLTGQPSVKLSIDAKANNLVALARPAQQATIRATLAQIQQQGQRVEVLRLMQVEPQTAVLAINKLFSVSDPKQTVTAPQIDADPASRQLMIRGTESQIAQIRDLLTKMGENLSPPGAGNQAGHIRTVPMTGGTTRTVLERVEEMWPSLRANKIRVVRPSAADAPDGGAPGKLPAGLLDRVRQRRPSDESPKESPNQLPNQLPKEPTPIPPPVPEDSSPAQPAVPRSSKLPGDDRSARLPSGADGLMVTSQASKTAAEPGEPAPIFLVPGPNGVTIASEDTAALDDFERLLTTVSERGGSGQITVFYLSHASATAVSETLNKIFGSGASASAGSTQGAGQANTGVQGPGGFPGPGGFMPGSFPPGFQGPGFQGPGAQRRDQAGAQATNAADVGGVMGRLGLHQRTLATGPIRITPEPRLNALFVQANRADLESIEQLLKILDLKESPEEIASAPKPRMIPVIHTRADDIATIVKQLYVDRMVEAPRRWPPFLARQESSSKDEATKVSVSVDTRTNTLIVAAPDSLFEEVKQLVNQLDVAAAEQNQTVRVIPLHGSNTSTLETALRAIAGDTVQIARSGGNTMSSYPMSPQSQGARNYQFQGSRSYPSTPWSSQGMPGGRRSMWFNSR